MANLIYYKNLDSKDAEFKTVLIDKPIEFDSWFKNLDSDIDKKELIFRGLNEAKYKIYSSAQRLWIEKNLVRTIGDNNESYQKFIQKLINNSRSWQSNLLEKYFNKLNHELSDFALLAIMQHYGLPSPLIDFTKDIRTALYFALEGMKHQASENEIDDYVSIYAIDISKNKDSILHLTELYNKENKEILKYNSLSLKEKLIYMDTDESKELNLIHYSNFNIINQQGVFLFNYHPFKYITSINIERHHRKLGIKYNIEFPDLSPEIPIVKYMDCINIHKSLKEYIFKNYLTNYSSNNIFPNFQEFRDSSLEKSLEQINDIIEK